MITIKGLSYLTNEPLSIEVEGGLISKIDADLAADNVEADVFIAPGLIDNQVNGYAGVDFSSAELQQEDVHKTVEAMWRQGVTTFLPTVITMPFNISAHCFAVLSSAAGDKKYGKSIPAFHLEGPYISASEGYRGAHNLAWTKKPDWMEFEKLNTVSGNRIRHVTLAPEIDDGLEFLKKCIAHGITVGLGHHEAPAKVIGAAVEAGARISTHLGNGCANLINRHENVLWPQLAEDRLWASIIADGHHLTREELSVFYKVKGAERLVLISDMATFAGMPSGAYKWNGEIVFVEDNGMISYKDKNILAGASLPLCTGIENMISVTGCGLNEAFMMASGNPAKLNRFSDRGILKRGLRADIIRFRFKDGKMVVLETYLAGECVHSASKQNSTI